MTRRAVDAMLDGKVAPLLRLQVVAMVGVERERDLVARRTVGRDLLGDARIQLFGSIERRSAAVSSHSHPRLSDSIKPELFTLKQCPTDKQEFP